MVQWLIHAVTAGGTGLIPDEGTKIPACPHDVDTPKKGIKF